MTTRLNLRQGPSPLTDLATGYAINIAVSHQGAPDWWVDNPAAYERILRLRIERGIEVDDFPEGASGGRTVADS